MLLTNFFSVVCTRGIMVSSLGFEANFLGSIPNSGYLFFSIFLTIVISQNTNFITLR